MLRITTDDGCGLEYRWDGPEGAPVLILSNSLGTNLAMWEPQIAAFAGRFRVLRYDSRGHGASDAPAGDYTIERLGRDALALLDALGVAQARFCGLSKGGMVGMWLGTHAPQRLARLVLSNTSAHMPAPELWKTRIEAVRNGGMAAIVEGIIERWFTPAFRAAEPDTVAKVAAMVLATPPMGYAGCCAAIRDMDLRGGLAGIGLPTLVIVGDRDPATPPEAGEAIAAAIPGARLARLPAAHLSNIELPGRYAEAVLDFLA